MGTLDSDDLLVDAWRDLITACRDVYHTSYPADRVAFLRDTLIGLTEYRNKNRRHWSPVSTAVSVLHGWAGSVELALSTDCLRLIRTVGGKTVVDGLNPVDDLPTTPVARRVPFVAVEWEKIKRLVERPFGELLFASAIVVGDGASDRAFLPHLLKHSFRVEAWSWCRARWSRSEAVGWRLRLFCLTKPSSRC